MLSTALTEYEADSNTTSSTNMESLTRMKVATRPEPFPSRWALLILSAFCDELAPFNEMEHEVELMTAKYEDTIGCLSGEEILLLDWMLED